MNSWNLIKKNVFKKKLLFIYDLLNGPLGMFSLGRYEDAAENKHHGSFYKKDFLYEDALVTLKINLFIHFVVLHSRPLDVLSVIQPERDRGGNGDAVTSLMMDSQRHPVGHARMTM